MLPTIRDYYRRALDEASKEIEATADAKVLGMDPDAWLQYLTAKWGMTPIVIDSARDVQMVETVHEYTQRGYDIYTDQPPGTRRRETAVEIQVPVEPNDTLETIQQHKLAPNTFSLSDYPPFEYKERSGLLTRITAPEAAAVDETVKRIQHTVQQYNVSIENENGPFRREVERLVRNRRERLAQKHQSLDALATAVGIRLTKIADPASVVPIAPKVKATIAPVLPPVKKPQQHPVLEAATFDAILQLVDNTGRQFERTPQSFSALTEEGLRDIILSGLNAVFAGDANGETFQGIGKCDIHLRLERGEIFIAELKFWSGPESLKEVTRQLRERLSWRDAYGVVVVLSRKARFTEIMQSVRTAVPACDGFLPGSLTSHAENHTVARFTLVSDQARQATIHVLVYNLFAEEPGDRIVRRKSESRA